MKVGILRRALLGFNSDFSNFARMRENIEKVTLWDNNKYIKPFYMFHLIPYFISVVNVDHLPLSYPVFFLQARLDLPLSLLAIYNLVAFRPDEREEKKSFHCRIIISLPKNNIYYVRFELRASIDCIKKCTTRS